jgi:hypothetical protein
MTLDRSAEWRSASATIKLKVAVGDTSVTAPGHLLYAGGEQYEVGFKEPYNRALGTFYVTPAQIVYWDTKRTPDIYPGDDTVSIAQLLPIRLPDWNPRDLLPFPISGRSAGFQTDSVWFESKHSHVTGTSGKVTSTMALGGPDGAVSREIVRRSGYEPVFKEYWRFRTYKGWPVATRVSCSNESGSVKLTWSLSGILLDADKLEYDKYLSQSKSEPRP